MANNDAIVKKVKIMASADWSMRKAMMDFNRFLDRPIQFEGKTYKVELGRIVAEPFQCGGDLTGVCDLIVDRTIHWNAFYKFWAQSAANNLMQNLNNSLSYDNLDKHAGYDLIARALHPLDRLPTTVLLPQFAAYTEEMQRQELWEYEQSQIIKYTKYGWDPNRAVTDWDKVRENVSKVPHWTEKQQVIRQQFYPHGNYLAETMEKFFGNRFPVFMKKAYGGGGSDVFKIHNMDELYQKYDESGGRCFHLQEAVEDYDTFVRCMAIGPQVLPMRYMPDEPLHKHYNPEKLKLDPAINHRLYNYVNFINSYYRWTYNSFEALVKNGSIMPIDFANACPDSNFVSLHVHFPWVICALTKWTAFCVVTAKNLKIDLEQEEYLRVLNDKSIPQEKKFDFITKKNIAYYEPDKFKAFCAENYADIEDRMIEFYDRHFDELIAYSIEQSDFPKAEHERFYWEYKNMMDGIFRPNAKEYLTTYMDAEKPKANSSKA